MSIQIPNINTQRIFTPNPITNIMDSDFELGSDIPITLSIKRGLIILFYSDNTESNNLVEVWGEVGRQGMGDVFAACNLRINSGVANAFNSLNMRNNPLHWAALKTVPFMLVYQNGFPIGFYNGERAVQPILDYSMTLACRDDYREPFNLYGGMQAEDNIGIKGIEQYGDSTNPFRKESLKYVAGKPLRSYNASDLPVIIGSVAAKQEAAEETSQEQQEGIALPQATRVEATPSVSPEEV